MNEDPNASILSTAFCASSHTRAGEGFEEAVEETEDTANDDPPVHDEYLALTVASKDVFAPLVITGEHVQVLLVIHRHQSIKIKN